MNDTIFHKIISKELPAEIVFEDDRCIAIVDANPVSDTHILVIPKATISKLSEAEREHEALLGHLLLVAAQIAKDKGVAENGYRLVINNGVAAGQTVFQLHIHLLAGRKSRLC